MGGATPQGRRLRGVDADPRRATMTNARRLLILPLCALAAACGQGSLHPPSLAPRAAEAIDPRLPVEHPVVHRAADETLRATLANLVAEARSGDASFEALVGAAQRAVGAAGAAQSEGWISAQVAVSALESARAPVAHSVAAIDALAAERVHANGAIGAGDLAAIEEAGRTVGAIDEREAGLVKALSARLRG